MPSGLSRRGHRLTPGLFPCCYEELVAVCFQLFRSLSNIFNIKFEPGGESGQICWPFVHTKTRLGSLRKRPEGKLLDPLEIAGVEVFIVFFFERETQTLSIESGAFLRIRGDRAVTSHK